jgi:hypothetical protein
VVPGCDFSGSDQTCTLQTTGAYAIEVQDQGFNATGTYSLHIQRLTAAQRCGISLACGAPTTTTINARADTDLHQFSGSAGQVVRVALSNLGGTSGFDPQWRLLAPDASSVAGCDTFSGATRDCTLPLTGAYAIEVEDGGFNATGTYSLSQTLTSGCPSVPEVARELSPLRKNTGDRAWNTTPASVEAIASRYNDLATYHSGGLFFEIAKDLLGRLETRVDLLGKCRLDFGSLADGDAKTLIVPVLG